MDGGKKRERLERRKEEKWNVGGSHCLFKRSQEIAKNRTPCSGRGTIWSYWARPQRRDGSRGRIPSINRRDYIALCVCWPYVFTAHCALNNLIEFARALPYLNPRHVTPSPPNQILGRALRPHSTKHGLHFPPLVAVPGCTRVLLQYVQYHIHTPDCSSHLSLHRHSFLGSSS